MATVFKNNSSLKLQFDKGLGTDGKAVIGSKTSANLKVDALADDILAVANALAGLQKHDLYDILKLDSSSIS